MSDTQEIVKTKYEATGRRKTSVARAVILNGTGKVTVNKRSLENYFTRETLRIIIKQPFEASGTSGKYDLLVSVNGGGPAGQAGAVRLALSRALCKIDKSIEALLRRGSFLTRDPRMRERKKYGQEGARRRFQFSKR